MNKFLGAVAMALLGCSALAAPGDDYVKKCAPSTLDVFWYAGTVSCMYGSFPTNGTLFGYQEKTMSAWVTLYSPDRSQFCHAQVPFSHVERRPNGETCTMVPKQPFATVSVQDRECHSKLHNGWIVWSDASGASPSPATAEIELDPFSTGQFVPSGTQFEFRSGRGTATFRVRLTANGQVGSWAYATTTRLCSWDDGRH